MIRISAAVWRRWEALEKRGNAESVAVAFESKLGQRAALDALGRAVRVALAELEHQPSPVEPSESAHAGWWLANPSGDLVILQVSEHPELFRWTLERVAAALEQQGVTGSFRLPPPLPRARVNLVDGGVLVDLLECRLRVRGRRLYGDHGGRSSWDADWDALIEGTKQGLDWALNDEPAELRVLGVSTLTTPMAEWDDARELLLYGVTRCRGTDSIAHLQLHWPGRFRILAVDPRSGRISMAEGGERIAAGEWESPLAALRSRLVAAAGWAAYGFIKRGTCPAYALLGKSLAYDWAVTPHVRAAGQLSDPFEHYLVPDAFGVQLLGSGYDGWTPAGDNWRAMRLGGATLVEHADPAAWYAQSFPVVDPVALSDQDPSEPILRLLNDARADFAPVLITQAIAYPQP